MDLKELNQKSPEQLRTTLSEYQETLRDLRFRVASKQVKNVREIREVKKTIARIMTLLRNKK